MYSIAKARALKGRVQKAANSIDLVTHRVKPPKRGGRTHTD